MIRFKARLKVDGLIKQLVSKTKNDVVFRCTLSKKKMFINLISSECPSNSHDRADAYNGINIEIT